MCMNTAFVAETRSNQIQHKQDLVIVFVTQVCSKEQWKTYYNPQTQDLLRTLSEELG